MKTSASKIVLFLIGLLLSSIALSAQSSDSLYCAPIWKIRKLTAMAYRVPVLDSLVEAQKVENDRLNVIIAGQEIVMSARSKQISLLVDDVNKLSQVYSLQIKLTDQEKKEKRQWIGIAIVLGILAVVQVFY
jgi:hypothetical protein